MNADAVLQRLHSTKRPARPTRGLVSDGLDVALCVTFPCVVLYRNRNRAKARKGSLGVAAAANPTSTRGVTRDDREEFCSYLTTRHPSKGLRVPCLPGVCCSLDALDVVG